MRYRILLTSAICLISGFVLGDAVFCPSAPLTATLTVLRKPGSAWSGSYLASGAAHPFLAIPPICQPFCHGASDAPYRAL
jgi:hypothetical protein